ncbi:hypothetical protein [Streptomyces caeruleatus]|uniref:Uncharacterized protein n=1 Tax=Streptomyces caeruleatus TaxID=661399 RepID=A0A101TUR2_9ACTN|nr:hypothetical protein [Streptomyces caeruleatus]KUN98887.1 hypothetical protein AQJ67_26255 [Streptomyces caeruleatus]
MPAGPSAPRGRETSVPSAQSVCLPVGRYEPSAGRGRPAHTPTARSTASSVYPHRGRQLGQARE